jgi:hypothetical protein
MRFGRNVTLKRHHLGLNRVIQAIACATRSSGQVCRIICEEDKVSYKVNTEE